MDYYNIILTSLFLCSVDQTAPDKQQQKLTKASNTMEKITNVSTLSPE